MTRKPRTTADPMEDQIERALQPGAFIAYAACSTFVGHLEQIAARIAQLINSDPPRAVALYEAFLAACHVKVEELDDSSGSFGQFVLDLYCGWITARQADGADPAATAARLLACMDDDDYGLCHRLDTEAARVFDKANLAAFVALVRARFDAAAGAPATNEGALRDHSAYLRRRWGAVLRTLYVAAQDVGAYVALAEESGLGAQDCHTIATLLLAKGQPEQSLAWVERGIDLAGQVPQAAMAGHDLARLKRQLLAKVGRRNEALDGAWADYRQHPSRYTYDELIQFVPAAERGAWHARAMDAAMEAPRGANLSSLLDLLLTSGETGRLADVVRQADDDVLEHRSHYVTEPIARALETTQADVAARVWRAQAMRIVIAGKSKYYAAALANFASARRCFECAGLAAEWQETVRQVRAEHHRKGSLMPGFERLVAGSAASDEPSFLDRAKARWSGRR